MKNAVGFIGMVASLAGAITGLGIMIYAHLLDRRSGRLPGQRWDKALKRWVDA